MKSLQLLLDEKIQRYITIRNRPSKTPERIQMITRALDDLYWKKSTALISSPSYYLRSKLTLNDEQRRLLDAGLIDTNLIEESEKLIVRLNNEINKKIDENIFYVSEWLQHQWDLDLALKKANEKSSEMPKNFRLNPSYKMANNFRMEAIKKLRHLIQGLPGVTPQIFETLTSGRLMVHLEDTFYTQFSDKSKLTDSDQKLQHFFKSLCRRLRERCRTRALQDAFAKWMIMEDRIRKLINDSARDIQVHIRVQDQKIKDEYSSQNHMKKNLRLLRSLIPLGTATSSMKIPFSPLFTNVNHCTKSVVLRHWEHIHEVDPFLPGDPDILIAPFAGNGFF